MDRTACVEYLNRKPTATILQQFPLHHNDTRRTQQSIKFEDVVEDKECQGSLHGPDSVELQWAMLLVGAMCIGASPHVLLSLLLLCISVYLERTEHTLVPTGRCDTKQSVVLHTTLWIVSHQCTSTPMSVVFPVQCGDDPEHPLRSNTH